MWRQPGEDWMPGPGPPVKVSLMIWAYITWNGVGTICVVEGKINAQKCTDILEAELWPVVARHYPINIFIFQDDNASAHSPGPDCYPI